jgi:hypothetical protein
VAEFPALYARVLIGVAAGIALGVIFKTGPIVAGVRNDDLGLLGPFVIRLQSAGSALILSDSRRVSARGDFGRRRLAGFDLSRERLGCAAIGLTLLNTLRPGDKWRGRLNEIAGVVEHENRFPSSAN